MAALQRFVTSRHHGEVAAGVAGLWRLSVDLPNATRQAASACGIEQGSRWITQRPMVPGSVVSRMALDATMKASALSSLRCFEASSERRILAGVISWLNGLMID